MKATPPETGNNASVSGPIMLTLPFLRRYARALTGNQSTGDRYAAATLEAILADNSIYDANISPRAALFQVFHVIWSSSGAPVTEDGTNALELRAQSHLAPLTKDSREALLLHSIEGFNLIEIGQVMQISPEHAQRLIDTAQTEMEDSVRGQVLIIEDEAFIAMDIESIVTGMGHFVTGIARTHTEAVRLGQGERPDLILADIKLADNSSGIDAVRDLLKLLGDVPVIFITAFPDRLLTGTRPEPTFLIGKPYTEEQLRSAVSQAMFFASTQTLQEGTAMARR
jgi:CheY-like chemotaxis protein/DNA-directed RNA polymerase specialized sigma24 family protein